MTKSKDHQAGRTPSAVPDRRSRVKNIMRPRVFSRMGRMLQSEDMGLGEVPGVDILADAMQDELAAISKIPVIEVARSGR